MACRRAARSRKRRCSRAAATFPGRLSTPPVTPPSQGDSHLDGTLRPRALELGQFKDWFFKNSISIQNSVNRKTNCLVFFCRYRRNNPGLEQAIIGTELLRLAGGPNRGWYPTRKSNQPRPASIEHLERLNSAYDARLTTDQQRKPLTLPTNITPNKYFGQSKHTSTSTTREALRRVTSLLIKKGKRRDNYWWCSRRDKESSFLKLIVQSSINAIVCTVEMKTRCLDTGKFVFR